MSDKIREAAEKVLEIWDPYQSRATSSAFYHNPPMQDFIAAFDALRAALAEPSAEHSGLRRALESIRSYCEPGGVPASSFARAIVNTINSALAEPPARYEEPLAWAVFGDDLIDHDGGKVDSLVFFDEKTARDCASERRYDDEEPREIIPLYPQAEHGAEFEELLTVQVKLGRVVDFQKIPFGINCGLEELMGEKLWFGDGVSPLAALKAAVAAAGVKKEEHNA